jgi:hypothetical protein
MSTTAHKRAGGDAGGALCLRFRCHQPGAPHHERSAALNRIDIRMFVW